MSGKEYGFSKQHRNVKLETVIQVRNYPVADLSYRGITKETCEFFGVRAGNDEASGSQRYIYYPRYNQQIQLCGYLRHDTYVDKTDQRAYTPIGVVRADCLLFGQKECLDNNRKRKGLVFVEGDCDMLASYQALLDSVKETKYSELKPFVVSLPRGTSSAVETCVHNKKFLSSFDSITLGFDNDECSPEEKNGGWLRGKEVTQVVASVLERSGIRVAKYGEGFKDPGDYLKEGKSEELTRVLLWNAEQFVAEKLIPSSQIDREALFEPIHEGVKVGLLPKLSYKLRGIRKKELTILTAPSGVGKTTVTAEIAYDLAAQGHRVGVIFLEEEKEDTQKRMLARHLHIPYDEMLFNPLKNTTKEKFNEALDWLADGDRFIFMDHFGSMPQQELLNKVSLMLHVHQVDFIVFDHVTMATAGTANTTQTIDEVLTAAAAFISSHDIGMIAISHLNREAKEEVKRIYAKWNRMKEKGEEPSPEWICTLKEDMRGSSSLESLAWNIIGIDMEIRPDRQRGRIRLTLLKNRKAKFLGECDILMANETTGLLEDASETYLEGEF